MLLAAFLPAVSSYTWQFADDTHLEGIETSFDSVPAVHENIPSPPEMAPDEYAAVALNQSDPAEFNNTCHHRRSLGSRQVVFACREERTACAATSGTQPVFLAKMVNPLGGNCPSDCTNRYYIGSGTEKTRYEPSQTQPSSCTGSVGASTSNSYYGLFDFGDATIQVASTVTFTGTAWSFSDVRACTPQAFCKVYFY